MSIAYGLIHLLKYSKGRCGIRNHAYFKTFSGIYLYRKQRCVGQPFLTNILSVDMLPLNQEALLALTQSHKIGSAALFVIAYAVIPGLSLPVPPLPITPKGFFLA